MADARPLVCFDLDGCLVDSRAPIATSLNDALADAGLPRQPLDELYPLIGPPLHAALARLLERVDSNGPVERSRVDRAVAAYRASYEETCRSLTVAFDGMADVLDGLLAAGRRLAVVTSKPAHFAEPILVGTGLRPRFGWVHGPAMTARNESKVVTLGRALADVGVAGRSRQAEVVMVGDRRHDVEAAQAHGCRSVGVAWGIGGVEELRRAGADVIVDAPPLLLKVC